MNLNLDEFLEELDKLDIEEWDLNEWDEEDPPIDILEGEEDDE